MQIQYHHYDLPHDHNLKGSLAIDTEAMGLNNLRDRLCLIQIKDEDGKIFLIHYPKANFNSPNLKQVLLDSSRKKIFHYARFDVAILQYSFQIEMQNIYCTKIASRLSRTYTNQHGLKDLCLQLLDVKLSKQQRCSDWGNESLNEEQMRYAANDVEYLHELSNILTELLKRENRLYIAQKCFDFLPHRAQLDVIGWNNIDIFSYSTVEG